MSDSPSITVGACGDALYVNIHGRATQRTCPTVDRVVRDFLATTPGGEVVLDVGGCQWFDSTFAGWLVKLSARCGKGHVRLANCDARARQSLDRMCLAGLFAFDDVPAPHDAREVPCATSDRPTPEELRLMLAAHEALADVSAENAKVFGPIVEMLRQQVGH